MNTGWKCPKCEWIGDKPVSKTIKKVPFITCPMCSTAVNKWVRPRTERIGCCGTCGNASFKLAVFKHDILRCCKQCDEIYNVDKGTVKRKGVIK